MNRSSEPSSEEQSTDPKTTGCGSLLTATLTLLPWLIGFAKNRPGLSRNFQGYIPYPIFRGLMTSTRAQTLQESAIRKLDGLIQQLDGIHFYRSNIGQPDVHTPEPMLSAIQNFKPDVLSYGPASGTPNLDRHLLTTIVWQPKLNGAHVAVTTGDRSSAIRIHCDMRSRRQNPLPTHFILITMALQQSQSNYKTDTNKYRYQFALPTNDVLDNIKTDKTRAFVFSIQVIRLERYTQNRKLTSRKMV